MIHKNAATRVELEYYLDKWLGPSGRTMPGYELGMLAFHGSRDTLYVGRDEVNLKSLAEIISGRAEGKPSILEDARSWPRQTRHSSISAEQRVREVLSATQGLSP